MDPWAVGEEGPVYHGWGGNLKEARDETDGIRDGGKGVEVGGGGASKMVLLERVLGSCGEGCVCPKRLVWGRPPNPPFIN